ncbi:hypothetical protein LPJ61_001472 [Coemansia biformis]|uniref:Cation efflux protein transmembrane domain-containing protein n=1 Tax=Coemansia biformis TaxID=1286918 RepID=A0A9W7Y9X6_9FUNG|nr:hypothetical protein LPJ61_001472 [Coemansia biformis]
MAAERGQLDYHHRHQREHTQSGCAHHCAPPPPPPGLGKRSSSRVFHDAYSQVPESPLAPERGEVSWRRLGRMLVRDHRFLGAQLYVGILHLCLGAAVWAAGIYANSLALMCYAFIVMYDACALLVALVPRALEYSGNVDPSVEYPFGLQPLQTVLGFANNITLLYRGVQALKEGAEHLVSSSHEHAATAEFETYAHRARGHNRSAPLGMACVAAAMLATAYSAARFANHHAAWEARLRQRRPAAAGMQNALLNPYNIASLLAGAWMLVMLVLVPADEESAVEPASCILVACAMAYISLPTCVCLGRLLLLAVPAETAASGREIANQVSQMPGVTACSGYRMWVAAPDRYAMALRVSVDPAGCNVSALRSRIASLLNGTGLDDSAIEIRIS